jgi:hypothetical protein
MMRSRIVCQGEKHMNWEFSGARNNVLAGWQLPASWHPAVFISSPEFRIQSLLT